MFHILSYIIYIFFFGKVENILKLKWESPLHYTRVLG